MPKCVELQEICYKTAKSTPWQNVYGGGGMDVGEDPGPLRPLMVSSIFFYGPQHHQTCNLAELTF